VLSHPLDLAARGRMLLGAAFAGLAIENSMLGAAHSAANPLTAHYGMIHGQAVGMMLPAVIRFNAADPEALHGYAELSSAPELACVSDGLEAACEALVARLEHLLDTAGFPKSLVECGVPPDALRLLAREAAQQWTASFNPRRVGAEEFLELYQAAMEPRGGRQGR
jgi:alcohol dehydrogenase